MYYLITDDAKENMDENLVSEDKCINSKTLNLIYSVLCI